MRPIQGFAAGVASLLSGSGWATEANLDLFFVPHDRTFIDDQDVRTPPIHGGGGNGAALRIESLPEQRHGWVLHAEYQSVAGERQSSDTAQTRLGLGGQLGRARFRVALYAEYSRLDVEQGHIDGAGVQVRFNFRYLDPFFFNVQLGHQCLEGELPGAGGIETQGFDLFELMGNAGYRLGDRWSVLAEGRRRWEVISPDTVAFDDYAYRLGVRMSY